MRLAVILKPGESGFVLAECPELPGCHSQGRSRKEALANITEAIELSLESRRDLGLPLPTAAQHELVELLTVEVA